MNCPDPFLEVRFSNLKLNPSLLTMCAGYEDGQWRAEQFASHLLEWLPEFCLKYSEIESIGSHNMVKLLKQSATYVYDTDKTENRGEIGELILHVIVRQEFNTVPLISKIFFKDSPNDTVKGFDCVHIIKNNKNLELWLGEAKFYKDYKKAISDVCCELENHIKNQYLRKEFIAICNKIDEHHFANTEIKDLLNRNNSLDKIFSHLVFPVLLTYESNVIQSYTSLCEEFKNALNNEIKNTYIYFKKKLPDLKSRVHLILVPLEQKIRLIDAFDKEIRRFK